jgi:DNA polymerase type B, organellar and viral
MPFRLHESEQERRRYQSERRKQERAGKILCFEGIDGEGIGKGRKHRYVLLGAGESHIVNPDGLTLHQILEFLYGRYESNPLRVYSGFYLSYDFTQWLKNLPQERARMLFTDQGIAKRKSRSENIKCPFPVFWEDWEMDILGMKRFKFRSRGSKGWMYICDAGPFFQSSFLTAIDPARWPEPICSPEEYQKIEEGKQKRDVAELDSDMIEYNTLENIVFSRLMSRIAQGLHDMGVSLKRDQWFGPGQAAQAWLGQQDIPTVTLISKNTELRRFQDYARLAYFGGWFEIFAHGHIPGLSYEYDINSAYPYIISRLPCLQHGTYSSGRVLDKNIRGRYILVHATIQGTDTHIGTMLHRDPDGGICRPLRTRGWYWLHEIEAAERAGLIDSYTVEEWVSYEPCNCICSLARIADLYDLRIEMGKDSSQGKSAKLVYNSVYGKFAQSIGDPKFANAVYASLITAGCRTMILDAIASHPEKSAAVLMVATDAIFFTSPHPNLPLSRNLGDWGLKKRFNLTLFKPGVYWDDKAREAIKNQKAPVFKARGVNAKRFAQTIADIDAHFSRWDKNYPPCRDPATPVDQREGWFPAIKFDAGFILVTCKQALQRNKWFLAGAVGQQFPIQDSNPIMKRRDGWYEPERQIYWSRPPRFMITDSVPYDKTFGLDNDLVTDLTADGPAVMLLSEALNQ